VAIWISARVSAHTSSQSRSDRSPKAWHSGCHIDTDHTRELTTSASGTELDWGVPGLSFEAIVDAFYVPSESG